MQRLLPRKNLVNDSSFLTREKIAAGKSEEVETELAPPNSGDCGLQVEVSGATAVATLALVTPSSSVSWPTPAIAL
jgi:hypothetical protein